MKYALVLESDLEKKDWICFQISDNKQALINSDCYEDGPMKLPKKNYPGIPEEDTITKKGCDTGINSAFRIIKFTSHALNHKFI